MQLAATAAIECAIRVESLPELVRLEAVARSPSPAAGRYRFRIHKHSESGRSDTSQSGSFTLEAGQEQVLTTVELDRSARGGYRAELVLESNQGSVTCTSP
jgi:hypothetical protein